MVVVITTMMTMMLTMMTLAHTPAMPLLTTPRVSSGKTSWTFPHDVAVWEGLGGKITPQALREMDGGGGGGWW